MNNNAAREFVDTVGDKTKHLGTALHSSIKESKSDINPAIEDSGRRREGCNEKAD